MTPTRSRSIPMRPSAVRRPSSGGARPRRSCSCGPRSRAISPWSRPAARRPSMIPRCSRRRRLPPRTLHPRRPSAALRRARAGRDAHRRQRVARAGPRCPGHRVAASPGDQRRVMADVADAADLARVEAVVRGRVQGVGFRYFAWREAHDLALEGWVANEGDGSVRCLVQGPRDRVDAMLRAARDGPGGRPRRARRHDLAARVGAARAVLRPERGPSRRLIRPHHRRART